MKLVLAYRRLAWNKGYNTSLLWLQHKFVVVGTIFIIRDGFQ